MFLLYALLVEGIRNAVGVVGERTDGVSPGALLPSGVVPVAVGYSVTVNGLWPKYDLAQH